MENPDMRDLRAFAAVAARRSFRRAALDLRVSVSSLSTRMRALERMLGVGLLHRTTRSVSLTESGERLLARLAPAFREVDDAVASLQGSGNELTGRLRINAPPVALDLVLVPLISAFLAEHPRITLEVAAESALIDIVAEGFDAGVRYEETLARDMVAVSLSPPQRYVVVAAPSLLEAEGIPKSPKELLTRPCLSVRLRASRGATSAIVDASRPRRAGISVVVRRIRGRGGRRRESATGARRLDSAISGSLPLLSESSPTAGDAGGVCCLCEGAATADLGLNSSNLVPRRQPICFRCAVPTIIG